MEREQVKEKPSVLICGYGVVGKNMAKKFYWADIMDIHQIQPCTPTDTHKYYTSENIGSKRYNFCFICVPTPYTTGDGSADVSQVKKCLQNVSSDVYIIKSTVPPTTTETLYKKYDKKIVFSPEYNGSTQHANVEYDFLILGGEKADTEKVCQLYQHISTGYLKIIQTDARTAELCKYMENSFLATKVVFCNEFYRIAKKYGINYSELRECFVADPRVNPSHTFVYEDYPYYDSKCLNKDIPALVRACEKDGYDAKFLRYVMDRNADFQKECNFDNGLE